jgi:hypothetical protein
MAIQHEGREADARAEARPNAAISDTQLQAAIYFSVGVTSEGSYAGKDVAHELRFAGNINRQTRVMEPVGNSGYSIGTLQTDLGQHPEVAREVVAEYQRWARANPVERPGWALNAAEEAQLIRDLSRTGRQIGGQDRASLLDNGVDINSVTKSRLNAFLKSDDGISFIHDRDVRQIGFLMRESNGQQRAGLESLQETTLYRNASEEDQLRLATIVAKLENQAGRGYFPGIVNRIDRGQLDSVADVTQAVRDLLPNDARGRPDYVESGCLHALAGTEVLIGLKNTHQDNPLRTAWQSVMADPLVNPATLGRQDANDAVVLPPRLPNAANNADGAVVGQQGQIWQPEWAQGRQDGAVVPPMRMPQENPALPAHYDAMKSLFLQPHEAKQFIQALDQGGTYSWPRVQPADGQSAGYFAAGNDFVMWNKEGRGHAVIDGAWREVDRQNLTRTNNRDGTVDISITENGTVSRLLHVDPRAPALRPEQQEERAQQQQPAAPQMRGPGGGRPDRDGPDREGQDREQPHAPPGRRGVMMLDDPQHQNFGMFTTFLALAHDRDDALKKPHDDVSKQLAGGLVEVARGRELPTVGFAQFSPDGSKVSMTDTKNPYAEWARTAVGDVAQLAGQPLSQSSENVAKINEQLALKQEALARSQTQTLPNPDDPTPKGPKLT